MFARIDIPYPERPEPPADLLRQIAVFRYCEAELHERAARSAQPWLWQVKGKVALFCRSSLERHLPEAEQEPLYQLTAGEEEEVRRSHPLLAPAQPATQFDETPIWLDELRRRVSAWLAARRRSADPD